MKIVIFAIVGVIAIAGCAPATATAPQGLMPSTAPRADQPDYVATEGAIALAQVTLDAERLRATQAAAGSTQQAQAVKDAQAQQVAQWTAQADIQQDSQTAVAATSTEEARGTATAEFAPYAAAKIDELHGKQTEQANRLAWRIKTEPVRQAAPLVFLGVFLISFVMVVWMMVTTVVLGVKAKYGLLPMLLDAEPDVERPRLTDSGRNLIEIYHGKPGAVSGGIKTDMPCTVEQMNLIAYWVIVREDPSLAILKWEGRGMSGPIDEIRAWFVKHGYADEDDNHYVEVNENGINFLSAWMAAHSPTRPSLMGNSGIAAASIHPYPIHEGEEE
jgi:hypothetical protein